MRNLDDQVDMVWHQGIVVDLEFVLKTIGGEQLEIPLEVGVIVEDRLAVIPAREHVVGPAVNQPASGPRHQALLPEK